MECLPEDILRIKDFERTFPARFSQSMHKDWGILFYCRDNPLSHDSNHAVITDVSRDWNGVLAEITGFYGSKGITPMLYTGFLPDEKEWLWPVLHQAGFTFRERPDCCMQWLDRPEAAPRADIEVRKEKRVSPDLARLILSDEGGDWTVKALSGIAGSPHCHIFTVYQESRPVAMAVLQVGRRAVRIDDVLTDPAYRGRGYATALMHRCVSAHQEHYAGRPLYLWTENPAAVRIYQRLGFRQVELGAPNWTAYRKRPSV